MQGSPRARFLPVIVAPLLLPVLASLLLATGCALTSGDPDEDAAYAASRERALAQLVPGRPVHGDLDCPAGRCSARYRIPVDRPGTLVVSVKGPTGDGPGSGPRIARVLLEGPGHDVLARGQESGSTDAGRLSLRGEVGPGSCFVVIHGLGGPLRYEVVARFDSPSATPPPPVAAGPDSGAASLGAEVGGPASTSR